jgi:hypothetical protein
MCRKPIFSVKPSHLEVAIDALLKTPKKLENESILVNSGSVALLSLENRGRDRRVDPLVEGPQNMSPGTRKAR